MDTFQSIDAFVRVAEASSFADVARQLGVAIRVFLAPNHAPLPERQLLIQGTGIDIS